MLYFLMQTDLQNKKRRIWEILGIGIHTKIWVASQLL